ncbi:hypothetical protein R3P38DRAFT_3238694 [Favolaschia claudopus]|uniref:Uncharacterized protein n=1 Tax=Favolaschia claudopus TaxID=2862362 RepID=A0AAV9Z9J4_9AGAR
MHCNFLLTFVVSSLAVAVSAAPISVPDANSIDSREIPHAPFVGISDVARAVEPETEPESLSEARNTDSEAEAVTEEARGYLPLIMVVPAHTPMEFALQPTLYYLAVVPLRNTYDTPLV